MSEYRVFVAPAYGVMNDPVREQCKVIDSTDQVVVEAVSRRTPDGQVTDYRVRLNSNWSYGTDRHPLRDFAARYGTVEYLNNIDQANRGGE